ncbi:hypothetical protein RvVAR031_pl04420 (plasmid) [Agrobacterium vitis]|nr:hypothetical protein RvVAR031_pl04420 [Agrobacterium vitis]
MNGAKARVSFKRLRPCVAGDAYDDGVKNRAAQQLLDEIGTNIKSLVDFGCKQYAGW